MEIPLARLHASYRGTSLGQSRELKDYIGQPAVRWSHCHVTNWIKRLQNRLMQLGYDPHPIPRVAS